MLKKGLDEGSLHNFGHISTQISRLQFKFSLRGHPELNQNSKAVSTTIVKFNRSFRLSMRFEDLFLNLTFVEAGFPQRFEILKVS